MNLCIFKGNLTRDPELTYTPKGTAVCETSIALNRVYYTEQREKREEVTYVGVTWWGKQAETVSQHFRKGAPILVQSRATQDSWDDKATGQKRTKTHFIGESFEFCGSPPGNSSPPRPGGAASPSTTPTGDGIQEDDIPF